MTDMHRRHLIATAAAGAGLALATPLRAAQSPLAGQALEFVLPLLEMNAARSKAAAAGVNILRHRPVTQNDTNRDITAPNVDTLYSSAWLDLSEPMQFSLPRTGARYFSLALMDMFTNNFAVLRGAEEEGVSQVWLVSPDYRGPPLQPRMIRSPTGSVWALGRTYVAGSDDLPAARAVQTQLTLQAKPGDPAVVGAYPPRWDPNDMVSAFNQANLILAAERPPSRDAGVLRRIAALGVGPGLTWKGGSGDLAAARAAFDSDGRVQSGVEAKGWIRPSPGLGDWGTNYRYRAEIALVGLAALPLSEATYFQSLGPGSDGALDGRKTWRLNFAPGQEPPVDAFWSLTLYERTPEGRRFLFPNPQKRFAIKSKDPALQRGSDGGVSLLIGGEAPDPALMAGWLPTPKGPFTLSLRAYRPRASALDGRWSPPRLHEI